MLAWTIANLEHPQLPVLKTAANVIEARDLRESPVKLFQLESQLSVVVMPIEM